MPRYLPIPACVAILSIALCAFLIASFIIHFLRNRQCKTEGEALDDFLSARDSQPWWGLAFSFYAGGMGSWLLFAAPEASYHAGVVAALAYGFANAAPFWLMIWLGPEVKRAVGDNCQAFTVVDFAKRRYGPFFGWVVFAASLFFMMVFLTAELTAIGGIFASLAPSYPPLAATLPVACITLLYTTYGGAPVSIVTDRLQGVLLLVLGVAAITVICVEFAPLLKPLTLENAMKPRGALTGYTAGVLLISTTINQFLDQGMWQRIFAAKSVRDVRWGLFLGGLLSVPTVALFGILGIVGCAANASNLIVVREGEESDVFFSLFLTLEPVWLGIAALLGVCLVCSTVDSLQSGLLALFAGTMFSFGDSPKAGANKTQLVIIRTICIAINAVAAAIAASQWSILGLFLVSNLLSCAVTPVIMLAFWSVSCPVAAIAGVVSGILTILVCGWSWTKSFVAGLGWFGLPDGPYAGSTFWSFVITPLVTFGVTSSVGLIACKIDKSLRQQQRVVLEKMFEGDSVAANSELSCAQPDPLLSISRSPTLCNTPTKAGETEKEGNDTTAAFGKIV